MLRTLLTGVENGSEMKRNFQLKQRNDDSESIVQ